MIWIVVPVLLILDWAALDDITTGNEPDYTLEYGILLFSAVVFAIIFWRRRFGIKHKKAHVA